MGVGHEFWRPSKGEEMGSTERGRGSKLLDFVVKIPRERDKRGAMWECTPHPSSGHTWKDHALFARAGSFFFISLLRWVWRKKNFKKKEEKPLMQCQRRIELRHKSSDPCGGQLSFIRGKKKQSMV